MFLGLVLFISSFFCLLMEGVHRIEVGISEADGIKNAIYTDLGIKTVKKVLPLRLFLIVVHGLNMRQMRKM